MLFSLCSYNICETSTFKAVGRLTYNVGEVQAATAAQSSTRIAARPYAIESVQERTQSAGQREWQSERALLRTLRGTDERWVPVDGV
jgi:hypothetical protein